MVACLCFPAPESEHAITAVSSLIRAVEQRVIIHSQLEKTGERTGFIEISASEAIHVNGFIHDQDMRPVLYNFNLFSIGGVVISLIQIIVMKLYSALIVSRKSFGGSFITTDHYKKG